MTDIATLTHHTHEMDKRLRSLEDKLGSYVDLNNRHEGLLTRYQHICDAVNSYRGIESRFVEIERFIKTLMDYFDPTPKMKAEINKLKKLLKEKDDEVTKIRDILKGALK
jgi:hypothetical protein